jgi:predicted HTH domain antitoxin
MIPRVSLRQPLIFSLATKNSELLETTLEKRLMELSREKYHVEQLEKSRGDPLDSHKVLVELLEKTPNEVAHELSKEGGLLGKVLDLVKATQIK